MHLSIHTLYNHLASYYLFDLMYSVHKHTTMQMFSCTRPSWHWRQSNPDDFWCLLKITCNPKPLEGQICNHRVFESLCGSRNEYLRILNRQGWHLSVYLTSQKSGVVSHSFVCHRFYNSLSVVFHAHGSHSLVLSSPYNLKFQDKMDLVQKDDSHCKCSSSNLYHLAIENWSVM